MTVSNNRDEQTDEQRWANFMVSAQSGNEADYRQLLSEVAEVIGYYLRGRFGNHHFIEDCVQDSLIAIHQARHTYDASRLFRPWMFAIVRHKTIDSLRHQRSQQRAIDNHRASASSGDQFTASDTLEDQVSEGRLINSLPPQHREAVTLTKIVGLSTAEAADRLNISESALKVRVHRAINKLKRLLEADEV